MQRNGDRDESVDRTLRQTLRGPLTSDAASGPCVDGETVAAWTEGALSTSEAAVVETHISQCPRCQVLLATFARTAPVPVAAESLWQRWHLRWLVPIAAAATAVVIWIAVPADQSPTVPQQFAARLEAPIETPQTVPPASAQSSPSALEERKEADRVSRPDSKKEILAEPVGRIAVEPNAPSRGSSEQEARAAGDETARAGRADLASRDRSTAGNRALAEEVRPASPRPAAASAPAELREQALQRQAGAPIEIVSPNPANRWRIVASTSVERSTTGGNTWEAAAINPPAELTAGSSPDPLVCWLVGRAGGVRLTTDGVRFQGVPFPEILDLVGVRATSARSAVVTAADGREFRTDDQGTTWSRVAP